MTIKRIHTPFVKGACLRWTCEFCEVEAVRELIGPGERKYYLARSEIARKHNEVAIAEKYAKLAELLPLEEV